MIFILEDDDSIRKLLEYTLKSQNFEVAGFSRPSEFWNSLEQAKPELILLDIMLPEEDGISVLKKLRSDKRHSQIPVIMLTAKDTEFDIVTGLDAGADDYITKPFGTLSLISRIKAVLRRYEQVNETKSKIIKCGKITVDINRHTVYVDDTQVFLTIKEFDLLCLLMENQGTVLEREKLLSLVWGMDLQVETRTIDVHIRTLRQKLKDENLIETVRGLGYRMNGEQI